MRIYPLLLSIILICYSCSSNNRTSVEQSEQNISKEKESKGKTEWILKEPLKSIIDSLIAIDMEKPLIQEVVISKRKMYDGHYKVSIMATGRSIDKELGKPLAYIMSNGKEINVYTGMELFFTTADSAKYKESPVIYSKEPAQYRIIHFSLDRSGQVENIVISKVKTDIPLIDLSFD